MSDPATTPPVESRVTVKRSSPKDNKTRQQIIKIDDKPLATLMFGEKATRVIAPGKHRLSVNNTFLWKTQEFEVQPGEEITFQVINLSGKFTWWMVAVLGAGPMYIGIEREA